ncbi:hypothetical protein BDV27DRAFT_132541 [Aspergillus caelatus]|uniref:Uncharacterized protein n=1 Tax=Aspergillus caelatus TaxID=61420 RepID=A0A5N6ZWP3_9EURO|nr:uncharacterized protein BDV27DRAFT_132541 [Aspergillus caelatus]KAE8361788.1 hypothetical protein BDV27DRAFT_132541 [Aspergillus caelatus]
MRYCLSCACIVSLPPLSCSFRLCLRPDGLSCRLVLADCLVTWLPSSLLLAWLFQPGSVECGLLAWVCASVVVVL